MPPKIPPSIDELHQPPPLGAPKRFPSDTALKDALLQLPEFPRSAIPWRSLGELELSLARNLNLAAKRGDISLIRSLAAIISPHDPSFSSSLLHATFFGKTEAFDVLLPLCDVEFFKSNTVLCAAAEEGILRLVNILAPLCITAGYDPSMHRKCPVEQAAANGHHECVHALLAFLPGENYSWAIVGAAGNGHPKCIEALLPRSNPNPGLSTAISMAIENGHSECVNLLMPELLLLPADAISDAASESLACSRHLAASRLSTISLSVAESSLLRQATPSLPPAPKQNPRL